ncbi:hypothetical protein [Paraburkholderia diazotrophica]|uniref:hypothetical protein n=1 Tax=Paraburkholderia diazotrophica TaxID=667676 RepID=UPI00316E211E
MNFVVRRRFFVFSACRWHSRMRGYSSVPPASAIAWLFQRAAGIRNCVVVSACRRHPQLRGCFSVPPASAIAPRGAGVAPVRGGTYSSLPRQRRVGRRKPLTPPVLDDYPWALNVPVLHAAGCWLMRVASAFIERVTLHAPVLRPATSNIPGPFAANCV